LTAVSSEFSDLLLFVSYFTPQNKEIKFGNYFFDVCCVNQNFLVGRHFVTRALQQRSPSFLVREPHKLFHKSWRASQLIPRKFTANV